MKLSKLGEFGLIEHLAKKIKVNRRKVLVGIGDDAAVLRARKDKVLIFTTDTLIENIHFKIKNCSFYDLGYRAIAVNISDIAAMGGYPTSALITLGLPKRIKVELIDDLYKGINEIAKRFKIDIVGGDVVASPKEIVIGVALLGEVEENLLLQRSGARVGDCLLVTGNPSFKKFKFIPRIAEARVIAKSASASSMIDDSDGIARCIYEICKMSKVGARIWITDLGALYGGESYELVFTSPKDEAFYLLEKVEKKTGTKVAIIGEITPSRFGIKVVNESGKESLLKSLGYEHFK